MSQCSIIHASHPQLMLHLGQVPWQHACAQACCPRGWHDAALSHLATLHVLSTSTKQAPALTQKTVPLQQTQRSVARTCCCHEPAAFMLSAKQWILTPLCWPRTNPTQHSQPACVHASRGQPCRKHKPVCQTTSDKADAELLIAQRAASQPSAGPALVRQSLLPERHHQAAARRASFVLGGAQSLE